MAEQQAKDGLLVGDDGKARCWWHGGKPDYMAYHDREWGRPTADDRTLFEKICLEGFQSGLSWYTILRKRENFRTAFATLILIRSRLSPMRMWSAVWRTRGLFAIARRSKAR